MAKKQYTLSIESCDLPDNLLIRDRTFDDGNTIRFDWFFNDSIESDDYFDTKEECFLDFVYTLISDIEILKEEVDSLF